MSGENKMKRTKNNKKKDGRFHSKQIKHDPNAESARAVFGLKGPIVDGGADKPISDAYRVIDTDLARDNLENDIPNADLQDL